MKVLVVIALVVAYAMADITVQYAGTTTGAPSWNAPVLTSGSPCTVGTTAYSYVTFNATFPTAGVREVTAMAERQFKSDIEIFIYRGSIPANVCSNLAHSIPLTRQLSVDGNGGPVIDAFVYFAADTYIFVVTGDTGGIFAAHVDPTDATGQTSPASPTWSWPEDDCTAGTSGGYAFAVYNWTQQATGAFDVFVFFNNDTLNDQNLYTALYQGTPSAQLISENSCNASVVLATAEASSLGLYYPAVNLTAGQTYTVVLSLDNGNYGYWGVHVIPTRIRYFNGLSGWTEPRNSDLPQCTANPSYNNAPYGVTFFQAEYDVYILDTAEPPGSFSSIDTYSFLYDGANSNLPPTTCPIFAPLVLEGDTGDVTPIYSFTNPGQNYTAVVSAYSSSPAPAGSVYVLYFYTGAPIGIIPSSTTSSSSSTGTVTNTVTIATGSTVTGSTVTGSTGTAATGSTTSTRSTATTSSTSARVTTSDASSIRSFVIVFCLIALSSLL